MRSTITLHTSLVQGICVLLALFTPLPGVTAQAESCELNGPYSVLRIDVTRCRPAPVSPEQKAAIIASLPAQGEITRLTSAEHRKLETVQAFLAAQDRSGIYAVKVIDLSPAWVGLHGRAVLLITRAALQILSAPELIGVVAHEIGHEYVDTEYTAAQTARDSSRLRELELTCDALAVAMLKHGDLPWKSLISALEAMALYNLERFGTSLNSGDYPITKQRRETIARFGVGTGTRIAPEVPRSRRIGRQ